MVRWWVLVHYGCELHPTFLILTVCWFALAIRGQSHCHEQLIFISLLRRRKGEGIRSPDLLCLFTTCLPSICSVFWCAVCDIVGCSFGFARRFGALEIVIPSYGSWRTWSSALPLLLRYTESPPHLAIFFSVWKFVWLLFKHKDSNFCGEILRWSSLYFMREFVLRFCELQHCINKKQCSRQNQSVSQSLWASRTNM